MNGAIMRIFLTLVLMLGVSLGCSKDQVPPKTQDASDAAAPLPGGVTPTAMAADATTTDN